jgi:hypothetical protein
MGFDRVALARFVVTEPVNVPGHPPWMVAGERGAKARDEYLSEPKGIFVKEDDPFGTILISDGSVPGKLEHHAGSTSAEWLKAPHENPYKERASEVRKIIEENLREAMGRYPFPRTFPALAAGVVTVFVSTNRFSSDPQYNNRITYELAYATDATGELIGWALKGLGQIYRAGYAYKKAGIILGRLKPAAGRRGAARGRPGSCGGRGATPPASTRCCGSADSTTGQLICRINLKSQSL